MLDIIKIYFSKLCVPNPQSKFTCLGKSSKFILFKFPIFDKFLYFLRKFQALQLNKNLCYRSNLFLRIVFLQNYYSCF